MAETFQSGNGLVGLDERQVRRHTSWSRWITPAMLAHARLPRRCPPGDTATRSDPKPAITDDKPRIRHEDHDLCWRTRAFDARYACPIPAIAAAGRRDFHPCLSDLVGIVAPLGMCRRADFRMAEEARSLTYSSGQPDRTAVRSAQGRQGGARSGPTGMTRPAFGRAHLQAVGGALAPCGGLHAPDVHGESGA